MEPPASEPTVEAGDGSRGRGHGRIGCEACQSALETGSQQWVSYMLLDGLVTPLLACDTHLEQFTSVCGLSTDDSATTLSHRPAGGLRCPGCQLASYDPGYPLIPVSNGAVAVLACSEHQSDVIERFRTGLRTRQQLALDLDSAASK